ncbi:YheC/YheD family protein [Paenibacillus rubinfantis]|uniref:YheC/YheD family protein n=1 Tax=Paenibacillus rubinfantis TaxID=1720296 RepID=UPI00073F979B|nr:YheC/YheD family protein [Paenibacillus rubinfantis]
MKSARHPRHVTNKWKKNAALMQSSELRAYLPETRRFSKEQLLNMLMKHKMVYVKPVNGTWGKGVMRVDFKPNQRQGAYQFQIEKTVRSFGSIDELYTSIRKHKLRGKYLIQQGIDLLRYDQRRFDLRVMVQRTPQKVWKTTGIIGRLGHPKKIVTNYHSDGKLVAAEKLLSPYLKAPRLKSYMNMLQNFGEDIANHLKVSFPGLREIGVDVALDQKLRPWILEVNTSPDPYIFRRLKDKSIFRTIMKYARAYGKYK